MKNKFPYLMLLAGCIILDQVTKALVQAKMLYLSSVAVIPGFANLTYIRNRGAIFGFFNSGQASSVKFVFITAGSLIALGFVIFYFFKTPAGEKLTLIALTLIAAGALGNMADRFIKGSVPDFIDLHIKSWHWPFFNVADSCISIGAVLLLATLFIRRKPCTPS
jgi:signal peptidase II